MVMVTVVSPVWDSILQRESYRVPGYAYTDYVATVRSSALGWSTYFYVHTLQYCNSGYTDYGTVPVGRTQACLAGVLVEAYLT